MGAKRAWPELTYDLPAGARRLQKAAGFLATVVNGQVVLRNNEHTGALPGQLLRGPSPRLKSTCDRGRRPDTVAPMMPELTYDLPAGARRLKQKAAGFLATVVQRTSRAAQQRIPCVIMDKSLTRTVAARSFSPRLRTRL